MENVWLESALWVSLALLASLLSIRIAISVALMEIMVGAVAGNILHLPLTPWVNYLAGVGALLLTFLAGAEIDPAVVKKHFRSSVAIGITGFVAPYAGIILYTHYIYQWPWPQAQIAGISLSTTSVAVVYAVMLETGFNRTEIGKILLAACFVNDLGSVFALGVIFANYNGWLALFALITALSLWLLPKFVPWFFNRIDNRISEPEIKFILLLLFFLGGMGTIAKSEAVLPAYLVGMVLAPFFLKEKVLSQRMRVIAFTMLTPVYFLKAGSLVKFQTVVLSAGIVVILLLAKMFTKIVGIWPLTKAFGFKKKEGIYTTLMMSTGLTFGSICALFGLTNNIINQDQYTILVSAVIGSAVVPTVIAQHWFQPETNIIDREESHNV